MEADGYSWMKQPLIISPAGVHNYFSPHGFKFNAMLYSVLNCNDVLHKVRMTSQLQGYVKVFDLLRHFLFVVYMNIKDILFEKKKDSQSVQVNLEFL